MENELIDPYGFIYITTNMVNGRKYLGQRKFSNGWKSYLGSGKIFKQAVKKYGKEKFIREIVAFAYSKNELDELEKSFIREHNAVDNDDYYNISQGGYSQMAGHHWSEEDKKKMSESRKGIPRGVMSEETKLKISINRRGKCVGEDNHNYGKHPSEEVRQKMSDAHKGVKLSEKHKQSMSFAVKGRKMPSRPKELVDRIAKANIKLTQKQVDEIRNKNFTGNYTQYELAKEYSVSSRTIRRVIAYQGVYKK